MAQDGVNDVSLDDLEMEESNIAMFNFTRDGPFNLNEFETENVDVENGAAPWDPQQFTSL